MRATALTANLGVPLDRAGRVIVEPDLTVPGHRNVFAIGDMAASDRTANPCPASAPSPCRWANTSREISAAICRQALRTFRYVDKGSMATIGRTAAIADFGNPLSGFIAWLAWLVVHIFFLIGFRNRLAVMFNWAWSYFTYQRGARLITGRRLSLLSPTEIVESRPAPRQREGEFLVK